MTMGDRSKQRLVHDAAELQEKRIMEMIRENPLCGYHGMYIVHRY